MQRKHRRAHSFIWTLLAIVMPLAIAIIFLSYPKYSEDAPAVRLDAPKEGQS